ncbi:MAG: hypothetical protein AB1347_06955 [Acidobacteriota bacterium]
MDRKEFLKGLCGVGACGCVLNVLPVSGAVFAGDGAGSDQRLAFVRYELAKMIGFMAAETTPAACAGILQKTGRECARLGRVAERFKGDPEGYCAAIRENWGTETSWDREKGLLTVSVAEGECGCPLVDSRRMPDVWCQCSVGYQKESFETVFGKPVEVVLRESKLRGSKRCVFEVRLA